MKKTDSSPLVEVFTGSQWEADVVKGLLEANDIPSMIKDETLTFVSPYSEYVGKVKVLVDEADSEAARKLINEKDS